MESMEDRRILAKRYITIAAVVSAVLCIAAVFLLLRILFNALFVRDYRNGNYTESRLRSLLVLNAPQGSVPLYNMGEVMYQTGDHDRALAYFSEALAKRPLHSEKHMDECATRVNAALSLLNKIDYDRIGEEETKEMTVNILNTARAYLTANGCAVPEKGVFTGHSQTAEQLKKEIDELLEQLGEEPEEQPPQDENQQQQQNQNQNQNQQQQSQREKELQKELEKQRSESQQERAESEEQRERERQQEQEQQGGGSSEGDGGGGSNNVKNW